MKNTDSKPPKHTVMNYPDRRPAGMTDEQAMAKAALDPAVKATAMTKDFTLLPQEKVHGTELLAEVMKACQQVKSGDLSGIEEMLAAQAYSLDAVFQNLALRAKLNMGEHLKATDTYMKLALRAQSQCRATAEALALLKNPQPYIRQANIGQAVQVNNGAGAVQKSGGFAGQPAAQGIENANPKSLGHCEPELLDAPLCAPARAREISSKPNEL